VPLASSTVLSESDESTHYVAIFTDISKLKQTQQELHALAHYARSPNCPLQSRLEHAIDRQRAGMASSC
jgi:uncharacterized protein YfcZ (UPF0381/DUF406 family)